MAGKPEKTEAKSPVQATRSVPSFTKILLFTRAAGRCEFDGCNKNVLEHPLTLRTGNYAQMAHVVAFRPDGPRGGEGVRPPDINSVANLMLLCPQCHKEIDDHPTKYPRARLEGFKREHEARVARLTELGPDRRTSLLVLRAPIGGDQVAISPEDMANAISPRYAASKEGAVLDLNELGKIGEVDAYLETGRAAIDAQIDGVFAPRSEASSVGHISVFALGPIPLLIHFGAKLTNKVRAELFQRHRDAEDWIWKIDGDRVRFKYGLVREGAADGPIALLLSLSGSINLDALPEPVKSTGWIYELTLEDRAPDPTFLRLRVELDHFKVAYQEVLGLIASKHGILESIELFPAVPAPIAVLCGRERLPKVHPALRVYDFDRARGGYNYRFQVG